MHVTYRYYDTFNLVHKHLSRFSKDGMEGKYYWRDINQNQDFKDLEAKMMVRKYFQCMSIRELSEFVFLFAYRVVHISPKSPLVKYSLVIIHGT